MTQNQFLEIYYDYIFDRFKKPKNYHKRMSFEISSYNRWAIKNLKDYILSSMNSDVFRYNTILDIIEDYAKMVEKYSIMAKTETQKMMFSIAYDIAEDFATYFV